MPQNPVRLETLPHDIHLRGLSMQSGDSAQARDIPDLTQQLNEALGAAPGTLLPLYIVTTAYDEQTGTFRLFIGVERDDDRLEAFTIPAGRYAAVPIKPALGFLWGPAIGSAKQAFFGKWLPASGYAARDITFERHDGPRSVQVLFGLEDRS